jgi:ethanolamine utilization protein EutN
MIVGKVVGSVVSTRKTESLIGSKFMIVAPCALGGTLPDRLVAVDQIGAGVGEYVLVTLGCSARIGIANDAPIDAAIVGIIDDPTGWSD